MGRVRNCGYEEDQRTLDGGLVFLFFIVTNRSVVFYYSKVKGVAPCDALLGYNNNYLRSKNGVDLSPVEGLFRPSTSEHRLGIHHISSATKFYITRDMLCDIYQFLGILHCS